MGPVTAKAASGEVVIACGAVSVRHLAVGAADGEGHTESVAAAVGLFTAQQILSTLQPKKL